VLRGIDRHLATAVSPAESAEFNESRHSSGGSMKTRILGTSGWKFQPWVSAAWA
jgi:hypothetical protein